MTPRKKPALDQADALDEFVQRNAKLATVATTKATAAKATPKRKMVPICVRIERELATALEQRRRELTDSTGFRVTMQDLVGNALRAYLMQPRTGTARKQL